MHASETHPWEGGAVPIEEWEARQGLRRRKTTKRARRAPVPDAAFEPSSPERWRDLSAKLARALADVSPGGSPSRHHVSLALAGALLARKVPAEVVPAITHDAAAQAGWDSDRLPQIRANACDTVRKWAAGGAVANRPPQHVAAVLDAELLGLVAPEPDELPDEPLQDVTGRMRAVYRALPDGLTMFKAGCGLGKTYQAQLLALERTLNEDKRDRKTAISVPTNELAKQIAADLRAKHQPVLRLFGPAGETQNDEPVCKFSKAAKALAEGGQSVRYELCEGRGNNPCPYRSTCTAADGQDGPQDAPVIVSTHSLVHDLDARAGKRGVLVIDEPPELLEDVTLTLEDLADARQALPYFVYSFEVVMAAVLDGITTWLPLVKLNRSTTLADALDHAAPDLVAEATDGGLADAVAELDCKTPPIQQAFAVGSRSNEALAHQLGAASKTLRAIHHALTTGADARVLVPHGRRERVLALTMSDPRLTAALQREGRVVVTAADADLHADELRVIACQPSAKLHTFAAPDGVEVRRVLMQTTGATRSNWIERGNPPAGLLQSALVEAGGGSVAVVTFKALCPWLKAWLEDHAPHVQVGHFGGLRGLDHWKHFDALVTLGDPVPNLDKVARTCPENVSVEERASDLARAELEQAHGRLRVVHRTTPCTQIHVGRLVPAGWRKPIDVRTVQLGGRAPSLRAIEARRLFADLGDVSAVARAMNSSRRSVQRWLRNTGTVANG